MRDFLVAYNESNGWGVSDNDLEETLIEAEEVARIDFWVSRWEYHFTRVVKIGDKYLAYPWSWFPENVNNVHYVDIDAVYEVDPIIVTTYRRK